MGYTIEESTDRGLTWTEIVASQTARRYSHTVPSGESRYYRVSAFNTAGTSRPDVAVAPPRPRPPTAGRRSLHRGPPESSSSLFFDEATDLSSKPDVSAFTITVGPTAHTPR